MAELTFKSRFCPSPTGLIHIGNLRTALFNVLLAKAHQPATFLLRIEDTDLARSQVTFTEQLMDDLKWLDLHWQEGPQVAGNQGPYFQAQRNAIYEQYYQQLLQQNRAYWCFCTDTELNLARKAQLSSGMAPRYAGTCRHLTSEQIAKKHALGLKPALRFRLPGSQLIQFDDFIQGPKQFASDDIGDFIICKNDNSASFMFCNAVDDALMEVTHVMRGEDHLTNTPRQLLILEALDLRKPQYGHLPLIMGFDGKPLSKRNGSQSIANLREQGYFPLAIINYLARLGHHFEQERFFESLDDMAQYFSEKQIGRAAARFDVVQLEHWQREALARLDTAQIWQWLAPHVQGVSKDEALSFAETVGHNVLFPTQAQYWVEKLLMDWQPDESAQAALDEAGPEFLQALADAIKMHGTDYTQVQERLKTLTQRKGKALFLPLRAAITGTTTGPELAKIFQLMGHERLVKRLTLLQQYAPNLQ